MQHHYLELAQVVGSRHAVVMMVLNILFWTVAVPGLLLTTSAVFTAMTGASPQHFAGVTFTPEVAPVPVVANSDSGIALSWNAVSLSNGGVPRHEVIRTGSDATVQRVCEGTSLIQQSTLMTCLDDTVKADVSYSYTQKPFITDGGVTTWSRPASSPSQQILAPKLRFGGLGPVTTATSSTSVAVQYPQTSSAGDVAILIVRSARKASLPVPTGWNALVQLSSNGPQSFLLVAWKVIDTETSVNVQMQGTPQGSAGWVMVYKRTFGNSSAPITATASVQAENGAASTTFTPTSSVTTSVNNAAVISLATVLGANTLTLSSAANYSMRTTSTAASGSSGFAIGIADQIAVKNNVVVGPPTWQQSGTAMLWQTATIAFS